MKASSWLVINKRGIKAVRRMKPALDWDEIAIKVNLEIPDALFERPTIDTKITVGDIPNNANCPEIVINTADLIEQQTGAKINFTVVKDESHEQEEVQAN